MSTLPISPLNNDGTTGTNTGPGGNGNDNSGDNTIPSGVCEEATYNFTQPPVIIQGQKLDILFVIDTSASLSSERASIAAGLSQFIAALPDGSDFRIGVILAHAWNTNTSGKLYRKNTEPYVLDSTTMTEQQILTYFATKMNNPQTETLSDGGEATLYSLNKAITTNLQHNKNLGFFRNDAALAVVMVSDENDICTWNPTYKAQYWPEINFVADPESVEMIAAQTYCSDGNGNLIVTHPIVLSNLQAIKADMPLVTAGIIYTGENLFGAWGENEIAYGILDLITLEGGMTVDLADPAPDNNLGDPEPARIAEEMGFLGEYTSIQISNLQTEFTLNPPAGSSVDEDSIVVLVNNVSVPFTFNQSTQTVIIEAGDAGGGSAVVKILYSVCGS